jgi:hypothetical protein
MNAEIIAKALGRCRAGAGWVAHCPAHDDRTPSLSIRDSDDGKVLVCCHAGCDQERVIAAPRARNLSTGFRLKSLRAGGALVPANGEHKVVVSENEGTRQP